MNAKSRETALEGPLRRASRRCVATSVVGAVLLSGCDSQQSAPPQEPFALGGKADAACPPESTLCWGEDDIALMHEMLAARDDVLFGRAPKDALRRLVEYANVLEHKLPDAALEALADVERAASELPEGDVEIPELQIAEDGTPSDVLPPGTYRDAIDVLSQLDADVLGDLTGAYIAANIVPLGQFSEQEINGVKADDGSPESPMDPSQFDGLTPDMERSVQLMYDSGVIGASIATVYEATGILEKDYEVINAENFGELLPDGRIQPSGLPRDEKARRIVNRYVVAAAAVGAGSGVASLIPVAGTALSITGETFFLIKLHAQMTFELAAVYGWDIRRGDTLYLMSIMLMGEGLATETADILISNLLVPMLAKKLAAKFGVQLGRELAATLATRSISGLVGVFTRQAQEQVLREALEGTARGITKTVLGWATLGAAVLVSAGLDAAVTWRLGRSVRTMSKQWLSDLMFEGSTYLSGTAARDCAFRAMAAMAWRDGEIADEEKSLFVAFLAKPYAVDTQTWFTLGEAEMERQGGVVAQWQANDSLRSTKACLEDAFGDAQPEHRVSLLGHMYSMMVIDGATRDAEDDLYQDYRDGLDGTGWFDGEAINEPQLDYVQRAIFLTANPGIVVRGVAPEHADLADDVLTEDVFTFLADPNEAVAARFTCGFEGHC